MFIITFIKLLSIYKKYTTDIYNIIANYALLDINTFEKNIKYYII